jgi:hypothetical protein
MNGMIEVTDRKDGVKVLLPTTNMLVCVEGNITVVEFIGENSREGYEVAESYAEVRALIAAEERREFAKAAMQGIISSGKFNELPFTLPFTTEGNAERALLYADALIALLNEEGK